MGRDVFVFIDGTDASTKTKTNIAKLADIFQAQGHTTVYRSGFGAGSRFDQLQRLFALDVEGKVFECYSALADLNLNFSDRLYIFGYSRGAIVARTLAKTIASRVSLAKICSHGHPPREIVAAKVKMLCLFEPVIGPRFVKRWLDDYQAAMDSRIENYVELISLNEARPHFRPDSFANRKASLNAYKRKILLPEFDSGLTENLELKKYDEGITEYPGNSPASKMQLTTTRKCIWFPGIHADIGGHDACAVTATHSLITAILETYTSVDRRIEKSSVLPIHLVNALKAKNKTNRFRGDTSVTGPVFRKIGGFFGLPRKSRTPNEIVINYAHKSCFEHDYYQTENARRGVNLHPYKG